MALLGCEGFDHQNLVSDLISDQATTTRPFQWARFSGCSLAVGTNFFNFGKCLSLNGTSVFWAQLTLSTAISSGFIGFGLYLKTSDNFTVLVYDSSAQDPAGLIGGKTIACQIALSFDVSNGRISAYRGGTNAPGSGTLLGSASNNTFPNNTAFFLEFQPTINSTTGSVVVKVNGTTVLNLTGQNTQASANANYDSVMFSSNVGSPQIDNLYLLDTTGAAPFNTFLSSAGGLPRVYTTFPSANSGTPQFTPSPNTNANWQNVDETAMDSDTTYNFSSTAGHQDLFTQPGIPATFTPLAVQITMAVRQDSAGVLAAQTVISSSGTVATGESLVSNQTYTYQRDVWATDPHTLTAWTTAGVNALLIGYKETV